MPGFNINGLGGIVPNTVDIIRQYRFKVNLPGFGAHLGPLYAYQCTRPQLTFDKITVHRGEEEAKYLGKRKWNDIEIGIYETVGEINKIWHSIQAQAPIVTANMNPDIIIKTNIMNIDVYNGVGIPVEIWSLHSAQILAFKPTDLNATTSDVAKLTLTVTYDRATMFALGI